MEWSAEVEARLIRLNIQKLFPDFAVLDSNDC